MKKLCIFFLAPLLLTFFITNTALSKFYIKDKDFADTGFFSDYNGISDKGKNIEWVYMKNGIRFGQYNKVIVLTFSSSSAAPLAASLKKDISEMFTDSLMGIFQEVEFLDQVIGPKDFNKIKGLPADAVVMGNIKRIDDRNAAKQFFVGFAAGEPNVYLKFKIVDTKTGEEVVRIIHDESSNRGVRASAANVVDDITKFLKENK